MLDTSGSMYGYQITLARVVAEKIIQSLSEHDLVNIILYNDTHTTGPSSCFQGIKLSNYIPTIVNLERNKFYQIIIIIIIIHVLIFRPYRPVAADQNINYYN